MSEHDQYLTFTLGDELFTLSIASVREIIDRIEITRIPRVPEFLRGVINLRGRAVPVVDMRLKFGMARTERTVSTCIIVTEVDLAGERVIVGALADSVQEVFELEPEDILPPPRLGSSIRAEFMRGMGRHGDRFIIILDIDRVFSAEELSMIAERGAGQAEPGAAAA